MKSYTVLSEVRFDGAVFLPGAPIELEPEVADPLLAVGAIADPEAGEGDAPGADARPASVREAIERLDPADPAAWTSAGAPRTGVLEALLGRPVTAKERNEAWAEIESGG